jgi:hypothetical protein
MYEVGIVPKRIERAPSIGSCGHTAVAAIFNGKSWARAVNKWLKEQLSARTMYDEEIEELNSIAGLVCQIIPRYLEAYKEEQFEPVLVEHRFEIPVRGTKIKLMGYWDALVSDSDGCLWLAEHKFPKQKFRSDEDLELDGQIGLYQYAALRLGYKVVGTIYNQLLARVPAEPKENKDKSLSRAAVYTDWKTYKKALEDLGLDPAEYAEMEQKLAGFKFFQRNYIYRPLVETRLFARDIERRIWDMRKSKKHIYRSESFIICGMCPYRELCLEDVKGGDVNYIIENDFEPKKRRKEEPNGHENETGQEPGA